MNNLKIKGRIKNYPNLVVGEDKNIYKLSHFSNNRTKPFRKLKYYTEREAYGYNGSYISKSKLLDLFYSCDEVVNELKSFNCYQNEIANPTLKDNPLLIPLNLLS